MGFVTREPDLLDEVDLHLHGIGYLAAAECVAVADLGVEAVGLEGCVGVDVHLEACGSLCSGCEVAEVGGVVVAGEGVDGADPCLGVVDGGGADVFVDDLEDALLTGDEGGGRGDDGEVGLPADREAEGDGLGGRGVAVTSRCR